jgi:hypothetical protein
LKEARLHSLGLAALAVVGACLLPASASADRTGGASPDDPALKRPGKARLAAGRAIAPVGAPPAVVGAIEAANRIATRPYRYGGGHARFEDSGYDCSGAVSYVLRGAGVLRSPLDSSGFMRWGVPGRGRWITVYTNPGHAYIVVAGLRFDTGGRDRAGPGTAPGSGPRWRRTARSSSGYVARHAARL